MKDLRLRHLLPALSAVVVIAACKPGTDQADQVPAAEAPREAAPSSPPAAESRNDFPTLARVEYVMQCMLEHGGQNYDNLYHCVCAADTVAGKLSYEDFAQAQTFTYLFNLPGERGGEFRDPPQSAQLRTRLKEAKALAQETCFPRTPEAKTEKK